VSALPLEALGPVKQALKRFFSDAPWTADDDAALADIVGPGSGGGHYELEPGLTLTWDWEDERFRLRVHGDDAPDRGDPPEPFSAARESSGDRFAAENGFGATFDGVVTPEATPSPGTIRFATPPLHGGAAKNYDSADAAATDARAARLFRDFDTVTNVLVGPDFVAVTLARPDRWEALLEPVLRAVTAEFVQYPGASGDPVPAAPAGAPIPSEDAEPRAPRRLEQAWSELGTLRADAPDDLERVLAASGDAKPARRQVAAALLADAPIEIAAGAWSRLLGDSSRAVRRSTVDAMAGAERAELRALLERALADTDAWVRWKALSGIAALGAGPSAAAVAALADDPDFRVRLEAARLLREDR
jgi:hypothetical protein